MEREKKTCKSKKCGNWWRPEQQAPKKESDFIDELSILLKGIIIIIVF